MKESPEAGEQQKAARKEYKDKIRLAVITGIIGVITSLVVWKIETSGTTERRPDAGSPVIPPGALPDTLPKHPLAHFLLLPVEDSATRMPLARVRFSVDNGQHGVSDGDGNIRIDLNKFPTKAEREDFAITLSRAGYKTCSRHLSGNTPGQTLILVKDENHPN